LLIRRIAQIAKTQKWSDVALELLVVVLGVFIGIQVSNWNEARKDQVRGRSYLERIRADLDADVAAFRDRLSFWERVSEYGALGLDYAATGDSGDHTEWDLLLAYFQSSQMAEFYTTDATYAELKSGGELGLIADVTLRNSLANYYTNAANPALSERPAYREHVRGLIPLDVQNYIWENCYQSNEFGIQVLHECDAPVDFGDAAQLVATISSDTKLMAELRYWMSTMHVASIIGRDRTAFAIKLRDAIDSEIGSSSADEHP
jgi:hypothetical protein